MTTGDYAVVTRSNPRGTRVSAAQVTKVTTVTKDPLCRWPWIPQTDVRLQAKGSTARKLGDYR